MNQPPPQQGPWFPPAGWPPPPYPPNVAGPQWYPDPAWAPPPPPKRGGAWKWVLVGATTVALVVIAAVLIVAVVKHQYPELAVGQCVSSDDYAALDLRPTDCREVDAVYQFAGESVRGNCPDGVRAQDGSYFYIEKTNKDQLCFALNLREADCYLMDLDEKTMEHASCPDAVSRASSSISALKVHERIDGDADASSCPTETTPLEYPEPARLYCLEMASGGGPVTP